MILGMGLFPFLILFFFWLEVINSRLGRVREWNYCMFGNCSHWKMFLSLLDWCLFELSNFGSQLNPAQIFALGWIVEYFFHWLRNIERFFGKFQLSIFHVLNISFSNRNFLSLIPQPLPRALASICLFFFLLFFIKKFKF